ncbi:MAG: hypothetical protein ABSA62_11255 [Methyloceanibacter sp.]
MAIRFGTVMVTRSAAAAKAIAAGKTVSNSASLIIPVFRPFARLREA